MKKDNSGTQPSLGSGKVIYRQSSYSPTSNNSTLSPSDAKTELLSADDGVMFPAVGDDFQKNESKAFGKPRRRRKEKHDRALPGSPDAPTTSAINSGKQTSRGKKIIRIIAIVACLAVVASSAGYFWMEAERDHRARVDSILSTSVESSVFITAPKTPNVLPALDFSALAAQETNSTLKSMHEYFAGLSPTFTNAYTGMFKGYNFIQIIAEAFSPYLLTLEPDLFPNLNRLYSEGFQFTNFYTPYYYQSTSDGEYVTLQSQIPVTGHWYTGHNSMIISSKNYLPHTTANQLADEEYSVITAYHNWNYKYYRRNETHPNLGYQYVAMGNGLDIPYSWPTSDVDMINATVSQYMNSEEHFYIYYLTMSAHQNYSWMGNTMCARHRSKVANLPYPEIIKAYLACNIELDLSIGILFDELEKAGIADRTLISLSADHYPYGLNNEGIDGVSELAGQKLDTVFEYYKSVWLLWSGSMTQPVVVDTLSCSMDILPTLNNLLGLKWDSRLLMGRDVFSNAERLVVFGSHSWITDLGRFNAAKRLFTPNEGVVVPEGYAEEITAAVEQQFVFSRQILGNDYFQVIYKKSGLI